MGNTRHRRTLISALSIIGVGVIHLSRDNNLNLNPEVLPGLADAGFNGQRHQQCKDEDELPIFRVHTTPELHLLQQALECTQKISRIRMWNPWTSFDMNTPMLDCGDEERVGEDPLEFIQSTIKRYQRIWFVGDSIMGQQFQLFQCMLDPGPKEGGWKDYMDLFVQFNHSTNSLTTLGQNSLSYRRDPSDFLSTKMEWVLWGYRKRRNYTYTVLYEESIPYIISQATEKDAIILDAGVHYNHERMELMEKALKYIAHQSTKTNATIYYMEPTPEEWRTSNGMYGEVKNGCIKLADKTILGEEGQLPSENISCNPDNKDCIKQATTLLDKLYPGRYATNNTDGKPPIPPASWRSDLAKFVFVDNSGPERIDHRVNFVPVFWHLVKTGEKSNRNEGDCTHKSVSATFFMNFQLLRAIRDTHSID